MAHRIDFKAIKEAASFERVLAHYGIPHRGRGEQQKALCPFHADARPSLNVNFRKKVFNCYPCGDGGDIIKFVAKKEYPSDPDGHRLEAAEKLAEICGIPLDDVRAKPTAKPAERPKAIPENKSRRSCVHSSYGLRRTCERRIGIGQPSALTFELKVDQAHPYLAERGLSAETIETFGLGYCVSEKSFMRHRILIPIHNERSELVAYAGRWPGDSGWPEGTDKYMLPPKFQKMRVLFNLNRVLEGSWPGHEQHVVVVEGFFGVFAVHPLAPSVALMGSVISPEHLALLSGANVRYVTLLLDGPSTDYTPDDRRILDDRLSALIRSLASHGFFVRAPLLGPGEQPDTISHEHLVSLVSL